MKRSETKNFTEFNPGRKNIKKQDIPAADGSRNSVTPHGSVG